MLFKLNICFLILNLLLMTAGVILNCIAISGMISREEEENDKNNKR